MKIPSGETVQRVLIQAKEENYYELFLLEFATGLRLRELAALQWDDLNLTTGELRIDKQASIVGSEVVICEPKTKAAVRTMILPPSVRRVLAEYKTKVDSRWMFPSPKKEDLPMRPSSPHKRLHRILETETAPQGEPAGFPGNRPRGHGRRRGHLRVLPEFWL